MVAGDVGWKRKVGKSNRASDRRGPIARLSSEEYSCPARRSTFDLYSRVIDELVAAEEWAELNDRFYKTLQFGTGGLRGRTIGKIVTAAERGDAAHSAPAIGRPEFPCVGTNAMNSFNISRATRGLVAYLHEWNARGVVGSTESRLTGKNRN